MYVALIMVLCGPTSCEHYEIASWTGPQAAQTCELVLGQLTPERERFCEHVPTHD